MAKQHLLIVDSDPKSLRVLEVSLKKAGFSITKALNGKDALDIIQISVPDMIISETAMPVMDGFQLIEELRKNSEWADIPVMFLTAQKSIEDKIRGLEQGVEDYLTKPIFIREILARVSLVIQRRQRERLETRGSKTEFAGSLSDMGIIDLIQTIDISQKSGVINVERDGETGEIFFKNGKVIDAETTSRDGAEAVYRMLVWSEGTFRIEFRNIDRADKITLSTQGLLMEGMRRLDEWGRLQEQLPPLNSVFDIDDELLAERLGEIPDEINALLKHFDGERTLMEVVDLSKLGDLEALTIITKLYFEGLICDMGVVGDHLDTPSPEEQEESVVPAPEETTVPENQADNIAAASAIQEPEHRFDTQRLGSTHLAVPDKPPSARPSIQGDFVSALSGQRSSAVTDDASTPHSSEKRKDTGSYRVAHLNHREPPSPEITPNTAGEGALATQQTIMRHVSHTPTNPPPAIGATKDSGGWNDAADENPYFQGETYSKRFGKHPRPSYVNQAKSSNPAVSPWASRQSVTEADAVADSVGDSVADSVADSVGDEHNGEPVATPADGEFAVPSERTDDQGKQTPKSESSIDDIAPSEDNIVIDDSSVDSSVEQTAEDSNQPDDWDPMGGALPTEQGTERKSPLPMIVGLLMVLGVAGGYLLFSPSPEKSDSPVATDVTPTTKVTSRAPKRNTAPAVQTTATPAIPQPQPHTDTASPPNNAGQTTVPATDAAIARYKEILDKAKHSPRRKKLELLLNAIALNPNGVEALTEFAMITMESHKYQDQSLEMANRAVTINPENARAWLAIGWIYQQRGDDTKSRKAYRQCAEGQGPAAIKRDCKALLR